MYCILIGKFLGDDTDLQNISVFTNGVNIVDVVFNR